MFNTVILRNALIALRIEQSMVIFYNCGNRIRNMQNSHQDRLYSISRLQSHSPLLLKTNIIMSVRNFSNSNENKDITNGENNLKRTLSKTFPKATEIIVEDISGGCGSMYQIFIESTEFEGLSTVKQHLLVNTALKKEIKEMHGLRIQTAVPKK